MGSETDNVENKSTMVDVKVIVVAGPLAVAGPSFKAGTSPVATLSPPDVLSPVAGPSPKAGHSPEAEPSPKTGHSPEAGPSPEAAPSPDAAPSPEADPVPEAEPSLEAGSSPVAGPSPKAASAPIAGPSPKVGSASVQESGPGLKRSPSNRTHYLDFDTVAVLNVWTRHQKLDLGQLNIFCTTFILFTMHVLEVVTFFMILAGLGYLGKRKKLEIICTVSFWLITNLIAILVKIVFQRNYNLPRACCSAEVGGFWNAFLVLTNPFKHLGVICHRRNKLVVLKKEFIHGETVTCDQFKHILGINRDELIDARDEMYDAFIRRLPMALVQFYFFYHSYNSSENCNIINGIRFLNVIINVMFTIPTTLLFEWKQKLFIDSLHVHGYLVTCGRYPIPQWIEDHVCNFLRIICLITYILSRFFLVGFTSGMNLGSGILSLLILLFSNWIITAVFPSVLSHIENLPVGVNIPMSYIVNRWINAFSWSSTQFNELSRDPLKLGSKKGRFPWVITQVFNFLVAFSIVYFFVNVSSKPVGPPSNDYLHSLNGTYNLTVCSDAKYWPNYVQQVSSIMYSVVIWLSVVCHRNGFGLHSMFHIHWTLFFVHLIFTIVYNIYSSRVFGKHGKEEYFPPMVTFRVFKFIFRDIFSTASRSKKVHLAARFMFLIALDLKYFTKLHAIHSRNDAHVVNSNKWWEEQIMDLVERNDPLQSRYREPDNTPNLSHVPIEMEIQKAYRSIQQLPYSFRLYLLCGHRFDDSLITEMTSARLEATIDMLQLSREQVLQAADQSIMFLNKKELA